MTRDEAEQLLLAAREFRGRSLEVCELRLKRFRIAEPEQNNVLRILIDGQISNIASTVTKGVQRTNSANIMISLEEPHV